MSGLPGRSWAPMDRFRGVVWTPARRGAWSGHGRDARRRTAGSRSGPKGFGQATRQQNRPRHWAQLQRQPQHNFEAVVMTLLRQLMLADLERGLAIVRDAFSRRT